MFDRQLVHKWFGGLSTEFIEDIGMARVVMMAQAAERRQGGGAQHINRFEVIDEDGRHSYGWDVDINLSYQDAGRTLKVFVKKKAQD